MKCEHCGIELVDGCREKDGDWFHNDVGCREFLKAQLRTALEELTVAKVARTRQFRMAVEALERIASRNVQNGCCKFMCSIAKETLSKLGLP